MAAGANPMEYESRLAAVPLLGALPPEDVTALARLARLRHHPSGAVIFRQGAPGDSLQVILRGRVRVLTISEEGGETTLALLGPGDALGELSLFDGGPRSASVIATERTTSLEVTRSDFLPWLQDRPLTSLAMLRALSQRLRDTSDSLSELVFLDLRQRLTNLLLRLSDQASASPGREREPEGIRLRFTQQELASMLGVTREAVNKSLRQLAAEHRVALSRGSVTVRDVESLRRAHSHESGNDRPPATDRQHPSSGSPLT